MPEPDRHHPVRVALSALCLLLATSLPGLALACEKTVRWANDPPYDMRSEDGKIHGATADLLREVLKRMGCEAIFVELPWARGLRNLEKGTLDILPGALVTPEREAFAYFSQPINRSPNVLFVNRSVAERFAFKSLAQLSHSPFRLGIQIGVVYSSEYVALLKQPDFQKRTVAITERRSGWQMIKAGRLDGMIADEVTGLLELQQLGLSADVVRSPLVVSEEPSTAAFSRKSTDPQFVSRFNQTLAEVIDDGTYVRLVQPHMPCPVSAAALGCLQAAGGLADQALPAASEPSSSTLRSANTIISSLPDAGSADQP
jgi:polar amino acid transport system substrate-binding protein